MAKAKVRRAGKTTIGIVGCGNISGTYFTNIREMFNILEITACADIIPERAKAKSKEFPGVRALSTNEIYADKNIDVILNLTPPLAHAEVSMRAVKSGKSVYSEKPLAVDRADAADFVKLADSKKLHVGCAPDTFLGAGLQTCRKLINDGWIGKPVAATAFMTGHGPESWHPDPEFFYKKGAGPLFDMGPYYLTTLISLLGPVKRVTGSAQISFAERLITSQPHYGTKVKVEVPTHVAGVLDFASGAVATLVMSFDVWGANLPRIEIYGSEGSLSVPDPNTFGGPVRVMRAGGQWAEVPLPFSYPANSRGLGLADMATAMRSGREHRASGRLAFHVLDLMHSIVEASDSGRHVNVKSTCAQPSAFPLGLGAGVLDD